MMRLVPKGRKFKMRRPGVVSALILLGGAVTFGIAVVALASAWGPLVAQTYFDLAFHTPGFNYQVSGDGETGNATFSAYEQMRYIGMGLIAVVFVYAGIARVMESTETGIVQQGTSNKVISKSVIFLLILLIFPPLWDQISNTVEVVSYWVLNPYYNVGAQIDAKDDKLCIDALYEDPDTWVELYHDSPFIPNIKDIDNIYTHKGSRYGSGQVAVVASNTAELERLCDPRLKVQFVFSQMLTATRTDTVSELNLNQTDNWLGPLQTDVQQGNPGPFTELFLGLTKALVAIQIFIMSLLMGIMADMLVAMVIAGLPVFLILSLIPKADEVANKFIEAIPALLLLPLMSAIIIVVGAGSIAEAPGRSGGADITLYTWITSLGVVFFAVTLPVLMVPLLKGVTSQAQQVVSSAVQSSSMVSGLAASGAAGGVSGAKSAHGSHAFGKMAMGGVGGMLGGMFSGLKGLNTGIPGVPSAGQITSGSNKAFHSGQNAGNQGVPTAGEQDKAADGALNSLSKQGPNDHSAKTLNDLGIAHGKYDSKPTDTQGIPNDQKDMVNRMDTEVDNWKLKNPNPTKDEQKAINDWENQPARTLQKSPGEVTKEDMAGLKEAIQKKTPGTEITDGHLNDRMTQHFTTEHHISRRGFRKQTGI